MVSVDSARCLVYSIVLCHIRGTVRRPGRGGKAKEFPLQCECRLMFSLVVSVHAPGNDEQWSRGAVDTGLWYALPFALVFSSCSFDYENRHFCITISKSNSMARIKLDRLRCMAQCRVLDTGVV